MLKALFLDLDETLCDTTGANLKAREVFRLKASEILESPLNAQKFSEDYLKGIYKNLSKELAEELLPITNEEEFRTDLIELLLRQHNVLANPSKQELHELRRFFDDARMQFFDFFPGVETLLKKLRRDFTLVVITNGPIYSQHPKIAQTKLISHVDHIIVGGEEPEEKPHPSIFQKACKLANCRPHEAIHFGDNLEADIKGAANAGIKSVWISANGSRAQEADHSINNFIKAESILEKYTSSKQL